jgi:zinc protease
MRTTTLNPLRIPKHILATILLAALCVPLLPAPAAGQAADWQKIPIPPLPSFHPQEPRRFQLPNGMVIFLQEDHELPLIGGFARIRGGMRSEPADKAGLVEIYSETWRTGGTKNRTGDELDDFLEARAAKVETGGGLDSTTIGLSCLKQDFDDTFKAFVDLLRNPEFRDDKIELAQKGLFDEIARRNDDIGQITGRETLQLGYGKKSPYARVPEFATVAAVSRKDLVDWHEAHVQPNNIILGLNGDFDTTTMEAKLREIFGSWPKGPALKKEEAPISPAKPGYYLVNKPDVNQSEISMVELGIVRNNPDYYAVQVFNEAFGGGFSSRLFKEIRSRLGLAYSVGGGVGSAFDHPGLIRIGMGTKSESTVESIEAIYAQIDELSKRPITDDEISHAKDTILNSFIFNFDSPGKVLRERMAYEFYGYPSDYLERYRAGIEKVTTADVARVAAKYLHKEKFAVLVVGNSSEFGKPVSTLGPVTALDITIPPPPSEPAAGTAKP